MQHFAWRGGGVAPSGGEGIETGKRLDWRGEEIARGEAEKRRRFMTHPLAGKMPYQGIG